MKVYVIIVDKNSGTYQSGMIDEPVIERKVIENALAHFGLIPESIIFTHKGDHSFTGYSDGTSWIFSGCVV